MSYYYKAQLSSGDWVKKRHEIYKRDGYACTICGSKIAIQVHHKDYIPGTHPWDHPNDMLTTLCGKHHRAENPRERVEWMLSGALKMKGFMVGDLLALNCLIDTNQVFTQSLLNILRKEQDG